MSLRVDTKEKLANAIYDAMKAKEIKSAEDVEAIIDRMTITDKQREKLIATEQKLKDRLEKVQKLKEQAGVQ